MKSQYIIKPIVGGLCLGIIGLTNPVAALANENPQQIMQLTTSYRTTSNLRLRSGPSLDSDIIQTVPQGSMVQVLSRQDDEWYAVNFDGTYGYMNSEYLRYAEAPIVDRPSEQSESAENGVELIRWSEVRDLLPRNTPWLITDVRTGNKFWVQSFSHGNHADVEPINYDSTNTMRNVFGGRWCWEPRPVWVTVDGRTIAASISGMPHAGTNNLDNGIVGHVCLHFYGSRTHNGNRAHERDHQNAVQEAFRAGN